MLTAPTVITRGWLFAPQMLRPGPLSAPQRPSGQVPPQFPAAKRTIMPSSSASTTLRVKGWLGLRAYVVSQDSWKMPQLFVRMCGVPFVLC